METTNRSSRKLQKLPNAEQIIRPSLPDKLSDLPDSVLCHILSFITTKDSVATSILAKRWRFLWAHVPSLDFHIADHIEKFRNHMSISDSINRVMQLHDVQGINTFRLTLEMWLYMQKLFSLYQVDSWIGTAISRNVQALYLHSDFDYKLPLCIFTCKTLVDLRLYRGFVDTSLNTVCLPSLKKLNIRYVRYEVDEILPFLISGCPVLEELEISCMADCDVFHCIVISSPTIKWLKLFIGSSYIKSLLEYNLKLEINTPALKYLFVNDRLLKYISAGTLNSLVEADIILDTDKVKDVVLYSHYVLKFVERLCQVKRLRLASGYKQFLESVFVASTTRFRNLIELELTADMRFLNKFLESADNLQVLIIRKFDKDLNCWVEPQQVPVCLSSHLRTVKIDSFGCSEDEFKRVSYILRNAKVLSTMEIKVQYSKCGFKENINVARERIPQFERGSETCELTFLQCSLSIELQVLMSSTQK